MLFLSCLIIPESGVAMIDFGHSRWASPHVSRIIEMVVTSAGEVLMCESLDGVRYELNLSGTKLHGFVTEYLGTMVQWKSLPVCAEFGMVSPYVPYIEPLFTANEFDLLPRNVRHRRFESDEGYAQLKRTHLVPVSIYDGEDLYYEQLF